mmetsp:Transcript_9535/g.31522  ORF Transcript_9535/g.31522 Transcript_9535/m.31522 type:complete len:334 (+) Transcript_9535:451-1452(+)
MTMLTPGTSMPRAIRFVEIRTLILPSRKDCMTRSRSVESMPLVPRPPVRSAVEKFLAWSSEAMRWTSLRVLTKMMLCCAESRSKMSSTMPSLPAGCSAASHQTCAISDTMSCDRSSSAADAIKTLEEAWRLKTLASMSRTTSSVYVAEKHKTCTSSGSALRSALVSSRWPRASISSASSRTSMVTRCVESPLDLIRPRVLPGVPTTMCAVTRSLEEEEDRPLPPLPPLPEEEVSETATCTSRPHSSMSTLPICRVTFAFCCVSSRVGQTQMACGSRRLRSTFCSMPSTKAAVLPEPDLACASMFSRNGLARKPLRIKGSAASWILNGRARSAR